MKKKAKVKTGVQLIAAERRRQVSKEGWTPDHDDEHVGGSLAGAAAAYALGPTAQTVIHVMPDGEIIRVGVWPWDSQWDKRGKSSRVRDLAKAGALIAAEIDRCIRRGEGVE